MENVLTNGDKIQGVDGRLMNPGHAIECGWFLLEHSAKINDDGLAEAAVSSFIKKPLEYGWDEKFGGIFYFMDSEGFKITLT